MANSRKITDFNPHMFYAPSPVTPNNLCTNGALFKHYHMKTTRTPYIVFQSSLDVIVSESLQTLQFVSCLDKVLKTWLLFTFSHFGARKLMAQWHLKFWTTIFQPQLGKKILYISLKHPRLALRKK